MAMKSPPHPGFGLRYDIEELGLSITRAAESLGVTRQQLNKVVTGKSSISPEMALRLEAVIGSTAEHWLRLQMAYDLAKAKENNAELTKGLKKAEAA